MRIPPSLFDVLTCLRSAFDQHYQWMLYLVASIVVGMLVSCVWGKIRSARPGRFLAFCVMAVVCAIHADKLSRTSELTSDLSVFGSMTPLALLEDDSPVEDACDSGVRISGLRVDPPTGAVRLDVTVDPVLVPPYSRLELHSKTNLLDSSWHPEDVRATPFGETNVTFSVHVPTNRPASFWGVRADVLRVTLPGLPGVPIGEGRTLFVTDGTSLSAGLERGPRPEDRPPPDQEFEDNPFCGCPGLSYDSTNGTLNAEFPGDFALPDGNRLLVLAPTLTFGDGHGFVGDAIDFAWLGESEDDGFSMARRSAYPLDCDTLWENWHVGTNTAWGCTCEPVLDFGADVSRYSSVTSSVSVCGDVATAVVYAGGVPVCTNTAVHSRYASFGGSSTELTATCDACSGGCEDGDCDAWDGPSLGSVRFRIALGSPAAGRVSGFLYFDRDELFTPSPGSFLLLARPDADVSDAVTDGVRRVVCGDLRGRTVEISGLPDGVLLSVTDTATSGAVNSWRIVRTDAGLRFLKLNVRGETLFDRTYEHRADGAWSETDAVSGLVESKSVRGSLLDDFCEEVERVVSCGPQTNLHEVVKTEVFGSWGCFVPRETERRTRRADGSWLRTFADHWSDSGNPRRNGALRMVWGDERNWNWHDYDEDGREVLRLEQRNGSPAPDPRSDWSLENLPSGSDCLVTVSDYTPLDGDSADPLDEDRVRTETRYVLQDDGLVLTGRTWTRCVRCFSGAYPAVTVTSIRACSQTAAVDDPGNAVSSVTSYSSDSPLVPVLLRGETVAMTDEDGVSSFYDHTVLSNAVLRTVVRRVKDGVEAKTRAVTERDLDYGNVLYEASQLAADPSVEFGWSRHVYDEKNRLRFTQHDDGTSETNAYSCCRLLFTIDRTGAKTLHSTTTENRSLYSAEESVFVASLPRGELIHGENTSTGAQTEGFPVFQRWYDAFGRETNAVRRIDRYQGASASPTSTYRYGQRLRTSVAYPGIGDERTLTTDGRGVVTETVRRSDPCCELRVTSVFDPGSASAASVTTNVQVRGGGTLVRESADGLWTERRSFTRYDPQGCRMDTEVRISSDGGTVTNTVETCDFLGRTVRLETPVSSLSFAYDGASSRRLVASDVVSGLVTTNLYDALGDETGSVRLGVRSESLTRYVREEDAWWRVDSTVESAGSVTNASAETRTRLTGLSDALRGETRSYENGVLVASSRESFDAATTNAVVVSWAADGGVSTNVLRFGRTLETVSPEGRTLVFHDSYGYPYLTQRSSPTGTSLDYATYAYRNLLGDLLEDGEYTLKTGSSTSSHWKYRHQGYDARGNPAASTNELGETVLRSYDARRNLVGELGDTYPVRYGCDSAGRRIRMETTRDGGTTWDETRWTYDPATGNLLSKIYADGSVETHTYTADGLPLRTTFPGGRWVENRYDGNRRLAGVSSDDPSCEAEYAYDAFGRTVASSNAIASASYGLAASGVATNEVQRVGTLQCALVRTVDSYGRVSSIRVDGGVRTDIAYAEDGRIASLSNADCRVVYRYGADLGDLGYDLILPDGTTFSRTLTRDRYQRGEVTSITNASPVGAQGVSYAYDLCGRPVSRSGDAFAYNRRGEVASATVSGQASSYVYDTIGNETRWEANALNQMVWNDYSANGELLSYSRGSTYDSLSRLVTVGCIDRSRPGDYYDYTEYAVTNRYDAIGRRVRKETPWETRTFFYDGWMPIVEIYQKEDGTTDRIEYVWGRDLSGTIGGAGGVGGLLYLKRNGTIYIPFYDAYGNVTGYWDETGAVVASYTYDAFGETLSASGPLADAFNIRYSTKYYDAESDLYYYGYRYYAPSLHRWLTRDPIAEEGGLNLYGMCENRMGYAIDCIGLQLWVIIYYSRQDQPEFRMAARTLKRRIMLSKSFDPKCDSVEMRGVLTMKGFGVIWDDIHKMSYSDPTRNSIAAMHILTHSGPGRLFFKNSSADPSSLKALKKLNWGKYAQIVCHGCESGICDASRNSVAGLLAKSQGVPTLGQSGAAQFSTDINARTISSSIILFSSDVYLWSYGDGGHRHTFGEARPAIKFYPPKNSDKRGLQGVRIDHNSSVKVTEAKIK